MEDKQVEALTKLVSSSVAVRSMMQSDGWKVIKEHIDNIISDRHNIWLTAKSAESAEILRIKTAAYKGIFNIINRILKEGDNAQKILSKNPNR